MCFLFVSSFCFQDQTKYFSHQHREQAVSKKIERSELILFVPKVFFRHFLIVVFAGGRNLAIVTTRKVLVRGQSSVPVERQSKCTK